MYAERYSIGGFDCSNEPYGSYWSSTLSPNNYHYYVVFYTGEIDYYKPGYMYQYNEARVRPIRRKN